MTGTVRRLAARALAAASRLLPARLSPWAQAMARELDEIPDDRAALAFAAGCLRAVLSLAVAARLRSSFPSSQRSIPTMAIISARPRLLGLACALGAAAVGMAYLSAAGAPPRYGLMNLAALVLGASLWLALGHAAAVSRLPGGGALSLALSATLLLTALFGSAVDGASRWLSVGPLNLQVSLVVLPLMIVLYARRPDRAGTVGMLVAALALALQPDRAMAGVLTAGLLALLLSDRRRLPLLAAAGAILAFAWTLASPDSLPPVPYVDQILYTAFEIDLLAGLAVVGGAALLVVPAAAAARATAEERPALVAFGACWLAVVAAAALGNYPTPLVGYGGSAVLGYLLSVALLPGGARNGAGLAKPSSSGGDRPYPGDGGSELRAALPATALDSF